MPQPSQKTAWDFLPPRWGLESGRCIPPEGFERINQLEDERHGEELHKRGILYAPDYIINAGGLINVADEIYGYDVERARRKTSAIKDVLLEVLTAAREKTIAKLVGKA